MSHSESDRCLDCGGVHDCRCPEPPEFFVDTDGYGDPCIWKSTGRRDFPDAILRQRDLPEGAQPYWDRIMLAFTEDQ